MIRRNVTGFLAAAIILILTGCSQSSEQMEESSIDQQTEVSSETVVSSAPIVPEQTTVIMTAGEQVITAVLEDSSTTRAFLETLPRTITMNHYGGREYYGRMEPITEDGETITDFENGDVTYYPAGPSLAIFFAGADTSSQAGLIRMGKITSDLSVFAELGDMVEFEIAVREEEE